MQTPSSCLFSPLSIGTLTVNGRVFKTATSETRASEDGYVTDELLEFYEPLSRAGTPLIITGNLYVTEEGKSTYRMCGADNKNKVPGLTEWANLVHSHGSTQPLRPPGVPQAHGVEIRGVRVHGSGKIHGHQTPGP